MDTLTLLRRGPAASSAAAELATLPRNIITAVVAVKRAARRAVGRIIDAELTTECFAAVVAVARPSATVTQAALKLIRLEKL